MKIYVTNRYFLLLRKKTVVCLRLINVYCYITILIVYISIGTYRNVRIGNIVNRNEIGVETCKGWAGGNLHFLVDEYFCFPPSVREARSLVGPIDLFIDRKKFSSAS